MIRLSLAFRNLWPLKVHRIPSLGAWLVYTLPAYQGVETGIQTNLCSHFSAYLLVLSTELPQQTHRLSTLVGV